MKENPQENFVMPSEAADKQACLRSLGKDLAKTLVVLMKGDGTNTMDPRDAASIIIKNLDAGFKEHFPNYALFNLYFLSTSAIFGLRHEKGKDELLASIPKRIAPDELVTILPTAASALFERLAKEDNFPDMFDGIIDKDLLAEYEVDIDNSSDKAYTAAALVMMLLEISKRTVAEDLTKMTSGAGKEAM